MLGLLRRVLVLCLILGTAYVPQAQSQQPKLDNQTGLMVKLNESVQRELKVTDAQKKKLKDGEGVESVLDEKQVTRLTQIGLQQQMQTMPAAAIQNVEIDGKLKLTDDQKEKIKKIAEEAGKKRMEIGKLFVGGLTSRDQTIEKSTGLHKETIEKITAVMSAEQKRAWQEMTGKPFVMRSNPLPKSPAGKK